MSISCPRRLDGPSHGIGAAADRGEVVVLDQNAVVEPHAVVVTTAGADGVLVEQPPAGNRLSRIKDAARQPGDGIDVARAFRWRRRSC